MKIRSQSPAVVFLPVFAIVASLACKQPTLENWTIEIPNVGFVSSVRTVDLNLDGIEDLVIGGGGAEFSATENGVTALDGSNGAVLWKVPARNQVIGSALFKDITGDGIPDVFIGGRSAVLMAIDGSDGNILWEYLKSFEGMDLITDTTFLNFSTPKFIPDQNGDGIEDLLVGFGGYIIARADETDRPVGSLRVIGSNSGKELARFLMPDGAETYMSPLAHDFLGNGDLSIVFGSGGETINGHLYRISLSDLLQNNLSGVMVLASGAGKGFIASPVVTDVNLDGIKDIVANPVNGNTICIDGRSNEVLWEVRDGSDFEVYTVPAPGFFVGNDSIPDFLVSRGSGPWPYTKFTQHLLIDGNDGKVAFKDTLGLFQYASPVVFDYNEDGHDDILLAINERKKLEGMGSQAKFYINELRIMDVYLEKSHFLGKQRLGANLGSTPLITDLDGDGWTDVIYCYMADGNNFYSFRKGKIERIELKIKAPEYRFWGGFMGNDHNGVY